MDPILVALGYLLTPPSWLAPTGLLASEAAAILTNLTAIETALQEYAIDSRALEVQGIVLDPSLGRSQLLAQGARLITRLSEIAALPVNTSKWGNLGTEPGYGSGSVFRPL